MTDTYMVVHNTEACGFLHLEDKLCLENIEKIDYKFRKESSDGNNRTMGIGEVITCNSSNNILFIVTDEEGWKTVIYWNLNKNVELANYSTDHKFIIKFDKEGKPFIIQENGKVMFLADHCLMNSFRYSSKEIYKVQELEKEYIKSVTESQALGISRGVNVDYKNNNWILFEEYLSLPFSYLSFAMLDKYEEGDEYYYDYEGHRFDITAFDYLFNM
jgi:hypothetical protein